MNFELGHLLVTRDGRVGAVMEDVDGPTVIVMAGVAHEGGVAVLVQSHSGAEVLVLTVRAGGALDTVVLADVLGLDVRAGDVVRREAPVEVPSGSSVAV